jgi:hypothetical protein
LTVPFGSSSFERSREASVENAGDSLLDCDLGGLDLRSKQTGRAEAPPALAIGTPLHA